MIRQVRSLTATLALPCGLFAFATVAIGAEAPQDESYTTEEGKRVIVQSVELEATPARLWDLYTTASGLESWAAPTVEVDLRIGGAISSNFKVGASIGEPGTVVTEIINLIPGREIALRDDLVSLLTMGGLFEWVDVFPMDFLAQLESEGDDVFTTTRFEAGAGDRTRLTVFSYGYGEGASWDRVYEETKKSNAWFLENLAKRVREGPIDWARRQ